MSYKDDELDALLKPLKNLSPNDLQTQKWQLAVRRELRGSAKLVKTTRSRFALQLVAAMLVGCVIGALTFKEFQRTSEWSELTAQFSGDGATFEHSHVNLD